jgi:hypothetical protein
MILQHLTIKSLKVLILKHEARKDSENNIQSIADFALIALSLTPVYWIRV